METITQEEMDNLLRGEGTFRPDLSTLLEDPNSMAIEVELFGFNGASSVICRKYGSYFDNKATIALLSEGDRDSVPAIMLAVFRKGGQEGRIFREDITEVDRYIRSKGPKFSNYRLVPVVLSNTIARRLIQAYGY